MKLRKERVRKERGKKLSMELKSDAVDEIAL
jgi:hypothetical protein